MGRKKCAGKRTNPDVQTTFEMHPSILNSRFTNREISPECRFDLTTNTPLTMWTIQFLYEIGFASLAAPVTNVYYPRLVALFYQNMVVHRENYSFTTDIDGYRFEVSESLIATAYGIDARRPPNSPFGQSVRAPFSTIFDTLRAKGPRGKTALRHVNLHKDLWFLDKIIHHNVVGYGHTNERTKVVLEPLYAAWTRMWFSPAEIIRESMLKITEKARQRTTRGRLMHLFFPYLITRILQLVGYQFQPHEQTATITGSADWGKSVARTISARATKRQSRGEASSSAPIPDDDDEDELHDDDESYQESDSEEEETDHTPVSREDHRDLTDLLHSLIQHIPGVSPQDVYSSYNERLSARGRPPYQ